MQGSRMTNDVKRKLYHLLAESVFDLKIAEVESLYDSLHNFIEPTPDLVLTKDKLIFPKDVPYQFTCDIIANCELFGIDLPFWFDTLIDELSTNKRIMVIGIDPLRNIQTFNSYRTNGVYNQNIVIGTPYAVHDKKMCAGKTKVYWDFIKDLRSNHFVYLTDIYKCYFRQIEGKKRSYDLFKKQNLQGMFDKLLRNEIELINPSHIVTFGNLAYDSISNIQNSNQTMPQVSIIRLPHPAARATTWVKVLEGRAATVLNKVEYMKSTVDDCLNR